MAGIPVRFKKVHAEMAIQARARRCESSGSEHSPQDSTDLFDLVNSYIEMDGGEKAADANSGELCSSYFMAEGEALRSALVFSGEDVDDENNSVEYVKQLLRAETGLACQSIGDICPREFKRAIMVRLREKGFDAGLCKSRWEKTSRVPAGSYEYVDVYMGGVRYIIEASLVGEFDIARPSKRYLSLLGGLPEVFAGTAEEMARVVKVMSKGAKESMKAKGITVPPWRRERYLSCKWFGAYKRTTNAVSEQQHMVVELGITAFSQPYRYKLEGEREGRKFCVVGNLSEALNTLST